MFNSVSRRTINKMIITPMSTGVTTCCPVKQTSVKSDYVPKNYTAYETGEAGEAKRVIIMIQDIFGMSNQLLQVSDLLSESIKNVSGESVRVVVPDFLGEHYFTSEMFPFKDDSVFPNFLAGPGNWEKTTKPLLEKIILREKARGATQVGLVGFCWGARQVLNAQVDQIESVGPVAIIHPAMVSDSDFIKDDKFISFGPKFIIRSRDDPALELSSKFFNNDSQVYHDIDQHHGFLAARANFNDEENAKWANYGIDEMAKFFTNNL